MLVQQIGYTEFSSILTDVTNDGTLLFSFKIWHFEQHTTQLTQYVSFSTDFRQPLLQSNGPPWRTTAKRTHYKRFKFHYYRHCVRWQIFTYLYIFNWFISHENQFFFLMKWWWKRFCVCVCYLNSEWQKCITEMQYFGLKICESQM